MVKPKIFLAILSVLFVFSVKAQTIHTTFKTDSSKFRYRAVAEVGFTFVLSYHLQLGQNGTYFDYVENGGQDVLFPA